MNFLRALLLLASPILSHVNAQFGDVFWATDPDQWYPTDPVAFTYDSFNDVILILENIAPCTMYYQYDCYYYDVSGGIQICFK